MELPLHDALGRAILDVWPRRSQQELLLDLGEHKRWGTEDRTEALGRVARYLYEEHGVTRTIVLREATTSSGVSEALRALGESLAGSVTVGVARWVCGLAPALGVSPKTLANGLRSLRDGRSEHRWLRAIEGALRGDRRRDSWAYHRRTTEAVEKRLGEVLGGATPDAGDAILWMSLFAAWQRRRSTAEARGNKGRPTPRRHTPKPAAALVGSLLTPGQMAPLVGAALRVRGVAGQEIALLAIEAALTEAHLTAHRARATGRPDDARGSALLRVAERALGDARPLLDARDDDDLRFRIARMRAYRDGRPQDEGASSGVRSDYVRASLALERLRCGEPPGAGPFDASSPGLMMLLPLLRSRGLLVNHEP